MKMKKAKSMTGGKGPKGKTAKVSGKAKVSAKPAKKVNLAKSRASLKNVKF